MCHVIAPAISLSGNDEEERRRSGTAQEARFANFGCGGLLVKIPYALAAVPGGQSRPVFMMDACLI